MTIKAIIQRLKTRQRKLAIERDKLRDLISEAKDLLETEEQAYQDLECAVESLSQLV